MSTTAKRSVRKRSRARGQSLVEFSLILPVFFLILAGILDFGFMLYSRMSVINAAREGARAAVSVDKSNLLNVTNAVSGAVTATSSGLSVTVSTTCIPKASASACDTVTGGATRDPAAGDSLVVNVTRVYTSFFPLLFGATFNLNATVQMVLE